MTVNYEQTRPIPLIERLFDIDRVQAGRYKKLSGAAQEIAYEGIVRHLRASSRMDVQPDASAVREIIDDALSGRKVWATTNDDRKALTA